MMRRFRIAAGSLFLVAVLSSPLPGQTRQNAERSYPIPKTLTMIHGTLPYWAEASIVLTENGVPNPAVWGDNTARIHEILETPDDNPIYENGKVIGYQGVLDYPPEPGCRNVGPTYNDYPEPPPRATLDDALTHNEVAVLGRVTGKAYGFSGGAPGQLVQIKPVQSFASYQLTQPRYYFFLPIGRFRIDGVTICTKDLRYAPPPEIGDEVFLFVYRPVDPAGVLLHVMDAGDVVPINRDGSLQLPRQYANAEPRGARHSSNPRTKSELLLHIQRLRATGAQP